MARRISLPTWFGIAALALALVLILRSDLGHRAWVSKLSQEGSPPPAREEDSPTGYVLAQRHFLSPHQRGETYRWIAATQDFIASGPWASVTYHADTVPEGRPQQLPKLYAAWLAAVAWGLHVATGDPAGVAVEQAALWEPVIAHVLAFVAAAAFMWRRFGPAAGGIAGMFFALFPPLSGQFLPGCLTTTTWALLFAAYAIALHLPTHGGTGRQSAMSLCSAVAASFALWLDPALGFPAVLIAAAAGAGTTLTPGTQLRFLAWSLMGAGITLTAWVVDQTPWNPAAGELRYVHPWYALAWLGIGLGLDAWQGLRSADPRRKWRLAEIGVAMALITPLITTQLSAGFKAWLYASAAMRRLTSLDETVVFNSVIDWFTRASLVEAVLVCAPVLAAIIALVWPLRRQPRPREAPPFSWLVPTIILGDVVLVALFKVRWGVVAALIALPVVADLTSRASPGFRRATLAACAVFFVGLIAWGKNLPASLQRPSGATAFRAADLEALVHRHFAHWMAAHHPGRPVSSLAPPELSDSLVFHGGGRVLLSTAWESYPGHIAASRVLSAPEASEAEAVLESLGLTHVVLTSWDKVLPLLVRDPGIEGKDTLYARLQRWELPRFLRPVPYRLPSVPGYLDQKLAVFEVTAPQDEGLLLSRLAEYFVEVERPEPAGLVAKVLAESFADDPNAALARATVSEQANDQTTFDRELARLAADATAGKVPFSWDRRVQRAILLVLGRRPDLARAEIAACATTASEEALFELTPLQAHRLRALAKRFQVDFSDQKLVDLLGALGAEYSSTVANSNNR